MEISLTISTEISQLLEEGNFEEVYTKLKGSESKDDILSLVEACFALNKFSEAKALFKEISAKNLHSDQIKKYKILEVSILHLNEEYIKAIDLGNSLFDKFELNLREKAILILKICSSYRKTGNNQMALSKLQTLLPQITSLTQFYQAEIFNALGLVYWANGDINNSLMYFDNALEIYEKIKDETGVARSFNNKAIVFNDEGELERAQEMYEKAIEIHYRNNNMLDVGIVFNNLAVIYQKKGLLGKSLKYYESGLDIMKKINNLSYQAIFHSNIGDLESIRGNFDSALSNLGLACDIFKKLNQVQLLAVSYARIGETFFENGDYQKGKEFMLQAIEVKKNINKLDLLISIYGLYWNVYSFNEVFDSKILSLLELLPEEPYESKNIGNYVTLINSIFDLKEKKFDKVKNTLNQVKKRGGIEFSSMLMLLKSLAVTELEIWKLDVSERNFINFNNILQEIIQLCETNNLITSHCDALLIQARFESSLFLFDKAQDTLEKGLTLAKNSDLPKHCKFFTEEIKELKLKTGQLDSLNKNKKLTLDIEELKTYLVSISHLVKKQRKFLNND